MYNLSKIYFKDILNNETIIHSPEKEMYYPIYYLYPVIGHENAVLLNIISRKYTYFILNISRETGNDVLSKKINLVQGGGGFLLFTPVYRNIEHIGFILGVYKISDFMDVILNGLSYNLNIILEDVLDNNKLLDSVYFKNFDWIHTNHNMPSCKYITDYTFDILNRKWSLRIGTEETFIKSRQTNNPVFVLISIIIIMIILVTTVITLRIYTHVSNKKFKEIKREFTSYVFHEIRVPFNNISMGIQTLLSNIDIEENEETKKILKIIKNSLEHSKHILDDVLDMNKIDAKKLKLKYTTFNIKSLVDDVTWFFSNSFYEKNIGFKIKIDEGINEYVSGDKIRLRQCLSNLLSNALKYTNPLGNVQFIINIIENKNNNIKIKFIVKDNGIGISKDKINTLFKPYNQILDQNKYEGGTGLGLVITKNIIHMHGGKLGVTSELGKGSEFYILIDFKKSKFVETPEVEKKGLKVQIEGLKVLAVDDSELSREMMSYMFDSMKIEYDLAENGKVAVNMCKNNIH